MNFNQYVSFSWSKASLILICRLLDRNEFGPASFFLQEIVCILHVAILHLFSTFSPQRSADQTSQDQQTEHRTTSSNGVTSETTEALEGTTHKHRM